MRQHVFDVEIGADGAFAIPAIGVLIPSDAFIAVGRSRDFARIDPDIGRHVQRTTMPVVPVESIGVGAVFNRLREINLANLLFSSLCADFRGC